MELNVTKKYMIFDITQSLTKDNKPYIRVVLRDKEGGQHNGIMFDVSKLAFSPSKGDMVKISFVIQTHNGQEQYKINSMEKLSGEDTYDFLPKSKCNDEELLEELKVALFANVKNKKLKEMLTIFFNDTPLIAKFRKMPAAKNVHHAYVGGLIEHTLSVVKLGIMTADYYQEDVDKDLLLMGALFHDIGKIFELDMNKGFDYTDSGKLIGHLLLGIDLINKYSEKIPDFPENIKHMIGHMIASHHGLMEYGSPKKPKTFEALILHHIDDMDAKMNTFKSIFEKESVEEDSWSGYDRLLERQLYRHKKIS